MLTFLIDAIGSFIIKSMHQCSSMDFYTPRNEVQNRETIAGSATGHRAFTPQMNVTINDNQTESREEVRGDAKMFGFCFL